MCPLTAHLLPTHTRNSFSPSPPLSREHVASAALCSPGPGPHADAQQEVRPELRPQLRVALQRLPGEHRVPVLAGLVGAGAPLPRHGQRAEGPETSGPESAGGKSCDSMEDAVLLLLLLLLLQGINTEKNSCFRLSPPHSALPAGANGRYALLGTQLHFSPSQQ